MTEPREKMEANSVSLSPAHWEIIDAFAKERSYSTTSAALRRIIDEWVMFSGSQMPLFATPQEAQ